MKGVTKEIMKQAMAQAKEGRLHILGEMEKAISVSRKDMSVYAPKYVSIKISTEKSRT